MEILITFFTASALTALFSGRFWVGFLGPLVFSGLLYFALLPRRSWEFAAGFLLMTGAPLVAIAFVGALIGFGFSRWRKYVNKG